MRVQEVYINDTPDDTKVRYILLNSINETVLPVIRYLKYLDATGKSQNTLKSYCYHLKLYFEFLEIQEVDYQAADLQLLIKFISWLRSPYQSIDIKSIKPVNAKRKESTINIIVSCVVGFYEYLSRIDAGNPNIPDASKKASSPLGISYKPFLHHITKGKNIDKNVLKIKEPSRAIKTLSNGQISAINEACNNLRDKLLIHVLYEGGLRISEALSLWIEDFNISQNTITIRNSKTPSGVRTVYVTENTMNLFQDYIYTFHSDEVDSNFVFINLRGKYKGDPLKYSAVYSLVKRLRKKVNLDFTPHMLRHTYATELHNQGIDAAILQKLLGHSQVQTTMQLYVHPSDELIRGEWLRAQQKNKSKE
ncbi:transposase [Paenibacillus sp. 79R4]|uniref:tyrosine-type recombinase/integrase n=1 Tax=Paenibacillus sp. 79R4 TaxID=2212847 RepID=UPI0015B92226|nr:tyrosine-type recombinase/integrase [Paenibacillus sp. 79R4]NWL87482.1 transposase [Paenibacillus sp. 79R4]